MFDWEIGSRRNKGDNYRRVSRVDRAESIVDIFLDICCI